MIRLAVFLGNPGRQYAMTRHNAAWLLCSALFPNETFSVKFHSSYAKEGGLVILKPLTMMNRSGTAVSEAATFLRLKSEEILVVHDDLETPLGVMRCQLGGGTKGHNGLKSIRDRLGSSDFMRLRIGIGRPKWSDVQNHVLSPFSEDEKATLNALFSRIDASALPRLADNWTLSVLIKA